MAPRRQLGEPVPASTARVQGPASILSIPGNTPTPETRDSPSTAPVVGHAADAPAVGQGITRSERRTRLLDGQNEVLELIAEGANFQEILEHLALVAERILEPTLCSIMLVDVQGRRLRHGAAPKLPAEYNCAIDGIDISAAVASCSTAAFGREPVDAIEIATIPLCANFRELAQRHGLCAWRSQPILSRDREVLGALVLYHQEPRAPHADEHRAIEAIARLAQIVIEDNRRARTLESANERFISLASTVPGVVYQRLVTPDGEIRYTYISDGARDLFGVAPEEIMADSQALFDCHGPDYRASFRERILAASRALTMWDVEAQIITRDGQHKWTHAIARPHRQPDGSVLWDGIILDATRIHQREQELRESEERFKNFAEAASDWFWEMDADLRFTNVSDRFFEVTKVKPEAVLEKTRKDVVDDAQIQADPEKWRRHFDDLEAHRPVREFEYAIVGDDGEKRDVMLSCVPVFDDAGTFRGYRGSGTDVTERKRAEEELTEKSGLLETTLENMGQGICVYNADFKLVAFNQHYLELLDFPPGFVRLGLSFEEIIRFLAERGDYGPVDAERQVKKRLDTSRRNERHRCEFVRPNDSTIAVRHTPMPDGGFVTTFTDITERKRAEEALRQSERALQARIIDLEQAQRELERRGEDLIHFAEDLRIVSQRAEAANRAKSEFLAAMSHELRTPLNAIIGFSEVMKNEIFGPVGSPKYRDYASDINDSGQQLLELINDILDLSKVESGADELHEEDLEVPEIIRCTQTLVRERARRGGVELEVEIPDELPSLRADGRKLKQILANLLTNAIKFTQAGGKVTMRTWCRADCGYVFQIADTGIGIAPEDIPKALTQFGQLDSDLNRKYEGTGLGLPLTRALVEMHGGSLDLRSKVGVGTTVTVRFPRDRIVIPKSPPQIHTS